MINIALSQFDLGLEVFYQEDGQAERKAKIVMSPQHYKTLVQVMIQNLQQYEELFGPINLEMNQEVFERLQADGVVQVGETHHAGRK